MSVAEVVSRQESVVSMARGYKELVVWQRSKRLVAEIYKLTTAFPKEEMYGLTNQMRRCAVSIPSNIAEGHARSSKEFSRFIDIAYGSLNELETQLEIACDLGFIERNDLHRDFTEINEIGRMLNGLKRSLKTTDA